MKLQDYFIYLTKKRRLVVINAGTLYEALERANTIDFNDANLRTPAKF